MNILKFPEDKSIESQLDERKAELDELYENLNKAFALVDKIEEKVNSTDKCSSKWCQTCNKKS